MLKLQQLAILLFSTLLFYTAKAQYHNINFDHIGVAEGLSQSNVLCVTQDSRGFMWFGTWDGLNKYDSYKITVYKNDTKDSTSISNNYINKITERKNGDLWVATNGGGLCLFNRKKENFTRFKHDPLNPKSIVSNYVYAVVEDDNGMVWTGTSKGLDLMDPATGTFKHFAANAANNKAINDSFIKFIFKDRQSNIWIGTLAGGVNLYNRSTNSFTQFKSNLKDSTTLSGNDVYSIFEDSKNNFWIGTNGRGLNLLDRKTGSFKHFTHSSNDPNSLPSNIVLAINEDANGNLWISTENGGISVFNYSTGVFTTFVHDEIDRKSISNNSVYGIYKDNKDNMWLANFSGGVDVANRDKWLFNHYRHSTKTNSLTHNQVLCISEDRHNNILIGTDGGGLDVFEPKTGLFRHFKNDPNNLNSISGDNVLTICEDTKRDIWTGSWERGITVYTPGTNSYKHFKNNVEDPTSLSNDNPWKIYEDREKNIWVGTFGSGMDRISADGKTFIHYKYNVIDKKGVRGNNVTDIFEDVDGLLWVGTEDEGLSSLDKKTGYVTQYLYKDKENSISNNSVNTVVEDSKKNLWIGTMNGLNILDKKTGKFTNFTTADGLPGNYIYGLLEDEFHQLWISTSRGLACYNAATKTFKNYTVSDGLQSNEFKQQAFCKARDGMMYFGGVNGFNRFQPSAIAKKPFEPPLVFTNFQIFNRVVQIETNPDQPSPLKNSVTEIKSITLPYSSAVFSFEFASLDYIDVDKKLYSYRLEGFDNSWSEPGTTRIATYTNLNPGEYFLKIKGLNSDGTWSQNVAVINIIIKPPYWMTWWFRLAVVVVLVGAVLWLYLNRLKNIRWQQKTLQEQVEAQTIMLKKSAEMENVARKEAETAHYNAALANKELVLKNKELEQFAYVASHDLQEPLRTTAGFAELLQKQYTGQLDDKADKYLHFIFDATERMKTLIKDLLDFSRIGNASELKMVDCNLLVKEMLTDISTAITESEAEIICTNLPQLHGYPTELKLLFQNLVTNAIKFRKADVKPKVVIAAERQDNNWLFKVSDNGIGIEMEYNERIFQIFQRLHTRSAYKGSGIGLSHCKKIVEIHHGKIWLESVFGEGSTFCFTFPADLKTAS